MIYRVVVPPHIGRQIVHLPPSLKRQIRAALDVLADDPYQGKPLKEDLAGLYSYRVTRYRIIYRIRRQVLEVYLLAIGHRRDIYQSVSKRNPVLI